MLVMTERCDAACTMDTSVPIVTGIIMNADNLHYITKNSIYFLR